MNERLIGWKEIARALRISVSSAQRYNRVRPLPIKRLFGRPWAKRSEIDKWVDRCSECKEAKNV